MLEDTARWTRAEPVLWSVHMSANNSAGGFFYWSNVDACATCEQVDRLARIEVQRNDKVHAGSLTQKACTIHV